MPPDPYTPFLLDVTRLVSRVGRGAFTGIDRVEATYLDALIDRNEGRMFALARIGGTYALLDRSAMQALRARLSGDAEWGPADWIARLHLRQPPARRRAHSDLRRLAGARRARAGGLAVLLRRELPAGTRYLNVGHTNLSEEVMAAVRGVRGARIQVLVHDTIPLDYPEYTRTGIPEQFAARLRIVGRYADRVVYNSQVTRSCAEAHFTRWGRVPPGVVAHLGVTPAAPDPAALAEVWPPGLGRDRSYFVILGTIEPRKNHALLLDIWERFAAEQEAQQIPALCIVGARGWRNEALFARLDASPLTDRHLFELGPIGDGAVGALLKDARALLFPSHTEGFGLPAAEAAALGVPVLCNDLPVMHEILGDYAVYAGVTDSYLWAQKILALTRVDAGAAGWGGPPFRSPQWESHFQSVLTDGC